MNKANFLLLFLILCYSSFFGQDTSSKGKHEKSFGVYVETLLFYKNQYASRESYLPSINIDYVINSSKRNKTKISIGYGREILKNDPKSSDFAIFSEINNIWGIKRHFLETGIGLGYVCCDPMIKLRLGYHLEFARKLILRIAYTPYFWLTPYYDDNDYRHFSASNDISVSLGYRFGQNISHEAWDINYRWLSNFQAGWQAGFEHYGGHGGFYGTIGFEFLLAKFKKLTIRPWLSYAYGPVNYPVQGFPVGLRVVYGNGGHFLETGMGFAWFPEPNGNRHGNYYTLQPEIGYRINLGKRFLASLAYTPYWWFADANGKQHIEKDFVHSATLGVGVRFH